MKHLQRSSGMRLVRSAIQATLLLLIGLVSAPAQPHAFTFAWLSDTHIGNATGEDDLRASVRDLNGIDSIAFVILSGDITEMGWDEEFRTAKSILDSLNKPYHIIPGNHDTKWSESGGTGFARVFGSDRFVFEYEGYRFIGLHQGPVMRMGDGHFAPEDLRWMDSVLSALPDRNQPLFFISHYPLDPQIDNWFEMTERLRRYNTQAVLVGHGHANRPLGFEGIPGIMGRSNLRARPADRAGRQDTAGGGFTIVHLVRDSLFFFERVTGMETKQAWHAIALGDRNYSADRTAYRRPSSAINDRYPGVRRRWVVETGFTIASAPAVDDRHVVVGNSSGVVECFALSDGARRWSFRTGATVYSSPEISGGRVVFGSSDGYVYCLNAADGTLVWKHRTGAPVVAAPAIAEGVVYIGGSDRKFRALGLERGEPLWEFDGTGAFVECRPLVYRGLVIFGAWDTYLYALNRKDGSIAWKWSSGNPGRGYSPAACWPVASNGTVFIVAPDRAITAIDASTGRTRWRTNRHMVREAIGISADGRRVYAKCMNDTLFAFSAVPANPELAWATDCKYGYDIDPSMPMEKNGTVFFGTKNGLVFALDAESGKVLWQHKIGNTIVNTVAPLDGRRVVVTDFDGRLVLLEHEIVLEM